MLPGMRKQLPPTEPPAWLLDIRPDSEFSRSQVLQGSLYYPASELDGNILKAYGGFAHSFVYVDPNIHRSVFLEQSHRIAGYDVVLQRDLSALDLCPVRLPQEPVDRNLDGDPGQLRRWPRNEPIQPFAIWTVLERRLSTHPGHGPVRLSIVFIAGEGVASYHAIYNSNRLKPVAIAMKRHNGFAGNWTEFCRRGAIFERVVMANPAGQPDYLFADCAYGYDACGWEKDRNVWRAYSKMFKETSFMNVWRYSPAGV